MLADIECVESTVRISGEIDVSNNKILHQIFKRLAEEKPREVEIDMRALKYLDSAGISSIVWFANKLKEFGGQVILVTNDNPVNKLLKLVGIDKIGNMKIVTGYYE